MDESKRRDSRGATSGLRSAPPLFRCPRRLERIHKLTLLLVILTQAVMTHPTDPSYAGSWLQLLFVDGPQYHLKHSRDTAMSAI
jgi:hypothetical protein